MSDATIAWPLIGKAVQERLAARLCWPTMTAQEIGQAVHTRPLVALVHGLLYGGAPTPESPPPPPARERQKAV